MDNVKNRVFDVLPAYQGSDEYVFVSYSHQNAEAVLKEIETLQKKGFNIWYDEGIATGEEWNESLANAISGCSRFVFFVTPESVLSEHCRRELCFADQHAIPVTAIHLTPTELPPGLQLSLGHRQAIIKYNFSDSHYLSKLTEAMDSQIADSFLDDVADIGDLVTRKTEDTRKGILVLPFANRSSSAGGDHISEGLADSIIAALSNVDSLRVISRNSSRQVDTKNVNIRQLGARFNIQYVLQGAVQLSGSRLRVTVRLPSSDNEEVLWAEKWDGTIEEIFDIQDTISLGVVEALKLQISDAESAQLTDRPIPNIQAYEFYLRARQLTHTFTADALNQALDYLQKGEEIVGENAYIVYAKGYVYWQFNNASIDKDPRYTDAARDCARTLFRLDPDSPDAHRLTALLHVREKYKMGSTISHLEQALKANANDTDSLFWLALFYSFVGKVSSGKALTEHLLMLDPLSPLHAVLPGFQSFMEGRFKKAASQLLECHEKNPGNPMTTIVYGQALAMYGQDEEAKEIFSSLNVIAPGSVFSAVGMFFNYCLSGEKAKAMKSVTPELEEETAKDIQSAWYMAECYALIGESEKAIDWLQIAVDFGFWNYPFLDEYDPLLQSLRGDQRFHALLADVKKKWLSVNT